MLDDPLAIAGLGRVAPPRWPVAWASIAFLTALLLLSAALRPLAVPDEGRYAEIGRWMLLSGDWLTPRLNGIPFFHKPPYLYWLEAASMAVFGVSAFAARLVVALHAVLMLVTSHLAMRQWAGERVAHRTVWILGSSLAFLVGGQYVNHDMAVAAWISTAIGCFALAFLQADGVGNLKPDAAARLRPQVWLARAGFAACALGVLSKGLIGLALPGLVLLVWLIATRQLRKVLYLPWASGLLIFCLIAVPWFVAAQLQFDQMLQYMFGKHQFGRYTGVVFNNARPFWFYGVVLVLLLFPWIGFVVFSGKKRLFAAVSIEKSALFSIADGVSARVRALLWIWLLAIVIFFSIPNSKLVGYMLPVVPALAALAALGWQALCGQRKYELQWFAGLCAMALFIAAGANTLAAQQTRKHSAQDAARYYACRASAQDTVYAVGDYPYDFPFLAQTARPMVVVQDWPALRKNAGDNWRRELFEGADFDAQAAKVLQTSAVLDAAALKPHHWVIAPTDHKIEGFGLAFGGSAWNLWRSAATPGLPQAETGAEAQVSPKRSAPKGPKTAQDIGLPGCKH